MASSLNFYEAAKEFYSKIAKVIKIGVNAWISASSIDIAAKTLTTTTSGLNGLINATTQQIVGLLQEIGIGFGQTLSVAETSL